MDIRIIIMGIFLLDCIDFDGDKVREKIYNKIMSFVKDLVKVGKDIECEFGILIVNKRVLVILIFIIVGVIDENDYVKFV